MVDIQSPTAEIRPGKKKKPGKNIMSASATQGGHKKQHDKNIIACPITKGGHKER